jgi:HNH endonuclease
MICIFKTKDFICNKEVYGASNLCELHHKEMIKFPHVVTKLVDIDFTSRDVVRINKNKGLKCCINNILIKNDKYQQGFRINIGREKYFTYFSLIENWNVLYSKMLYSMKIWLDIDSIFEIPIKQIKKENIDIILNRLKLTLIKENKDIIWNGLKLTPIKNFELEYYYITECGRVFSYKYKHIIELKPRIVSCYYNIGVFKNKKRVYKYVHRLVAETYISNPNNYKVVNHKNGNKLDNRKENLEYVTFSENRIHALKIGLIKPQSDSIKITDKEYNSLKPWKKIEEFPLYEFSWFGTIINQKTKILLRYTGKDYDQCSILNRYGKKGTKLVHRLIAEAHIKCHEDIEKLQIDHIDRNGKNNRVDNLRWCTASQNNMNKNIEYIKIRMLDIDKKEIKIYDSVKDCLKENTFLTYAGIGKSYRKHIKHNNFYFERL